MEITQPITLRVFSGSDSACLHQLQVSIQRFIISTQGAREFLTVEYHSNRSIRTDKYVEEFRNPNGLIDWLQRAHIYIIASQGVWLGQSTSRAALKDGWDVGRIKQAMIRLSQTPAFGFPCGKQLLDPVWLGDKYEYIDLLKNDGLCIPTLKIDMNRFCDEPFDVSLGYEIYE